MSEWKPIETARTVVGDYLVYQPEHKAGRNMLPARITLMSQAGHHRNITHWHPLPNSPVSTHNPEKEE